MISFLKKAPKIPLTPCTRVLQRVSRHRALNPRLLLRKICTGRINSSKTMQQYQNEQADLLEKIKPFKWLSSKAPCFSLSACKVKVLTQPHEFYRTLVEKAAEAENRVTLASLYLGTGTHEKDIVKVLENSLSSKNKSDLRVRILLDATRGSRGTAKGQETSRTMLLPLLESFSQQCSVHLYHTPALRGLLKKTLPERWNEIVGLQHMKIYIFDNSLLISGANLSHDYFTNRQDRYLLIEDSKELVDFFDELVETVCQFSFELNSKNEVKMNAEFPYHPVDSDHSVFMMEAKQRIELLYKKYMETSYPPDSAPLEWPNKNSCDTWIFPLVQMGQLGVHHDALATRHILSNLPANSELTIATGYFNLTKDYMNSILESTQPNVHILMAHPLANGFYGARGFAGGIPAGYTLIAYQFYRRIVESAHEARIRLWEYKRQNWTFHAKGLWISFTGADSRPFFTLIGSPNFGYRSVYNDLEAQLAVVTINSSLRDQLHKERRDLFQTAEPVDASTFEYPDRKIPLWVRCVIKVFRRFF